MFVGITNTPRDYPWGSKTAIADLLGTPASGGPEAEVWLGAHPGSPSVILDPSRVGGARNLGEWVAADPALALGVPAAAVASTVSVSPSASRTSSASEEPRLPFLLKVLAAASPLSLQAHPTTAQAKAGFARENAAGISLDAPSRNYKDASAKPEIILALSDTFEALCGFRSAASVRASLDVLAAADAAGGAGSAGSPDVSGSSIASLRDRLTDDAALRPTFEWLISRGDGVDELVSRVVAASGRVAGSDAGASDGGAPGEAGLEFSTVLSLAAQYPGDPGIVISLLVNRISLKRGEVLYLPAGNIHAYLLGLGIEVMASSDNVLRGGLTPKYVDVPELLSVLDFSPLPVPYLPPTEIAPGVVVFRPDVKDFVLVHASGVSLAATYPLAGPAIALCLSGSFTLSGARASVVVGRGESVYVTPDERDVRFEGSGELVMATTGV